MKKIIKTLLVFVLLLVPVAIASAAVNSNNGTITVKNTKAGKTYSVYEIFKLESYSNSGDAFSYTVMDDFEEFVTTGEGKNYVDVNEAGYVTWKTGASEKDFSQKALAYVKEKGINPSVESKTAQTDGEEVKFEGLNLGYYLVDSSLGALCGLTTTKPDAEIEEKNGEPTVEKEVEELPAGSWGEENSASIGDTVNFRTTITVRSGAQNYVLHDVMNKGLALVENSIEVKVNGQTVNASNYTITYGVENYDATTKDTFTIKFNDSYVAGLADGTTIVVTYSAKLTSDAVIGVEGNPNKTYLDYGENNRTTEDTTKTYTFEFDIVKTNTSKKLLTGAQFKLYTAKTGGKEVPVKKVSEGVYRVDTTLTEGDIIEAGHVTIVGLDNGTYYLDEIKAPDGYNKLTSRVEIIINNANNNATLVGDIYQNGGVQVINNTGAELPSTGGIGTTLFITIGSILVLAMGTILVTKLRVSKMEI